MKQAPSRHAVAITTLFRQFRLLAGVALAILLPLNAYSVERETLGTITRLYAYTQYGSGTVHGDVVIEVSNPPAQCANGFWLSPNDAGFKNAYAMLLSAYHTQAAVRVSGEDTQLWSGTGGQVCRVNFVALD